MDKDKTDKDDSRKSADSKKVNNTKNNTDKNGNTETFIRSNKKSNIKMNMSVKVIE